LNEKVMNFKFVSKKTFSIETVNCESSITALEYSLNLNYKYWWQYYGVTPMIANWWLLDHAWNTPCKYQRINIQTVNFVLNHKIFNLLLSIGDEKTQFSYCKSKDFIA
jgi:hypothetical protein